MFVNNPLLRSLNRWELFEYVFTALVVLSCVGEAIAQFGHEVSWRQRLGKVCTMVLATALAFEFVCLIMVNKRFDQIMGGTDQLARDAANHAAAADSSAIRAVTGASSALQLAESASTSSRNAAMLSENAQGRSRTALQQSEIAEQRNHVATLIAEMNADDALALDSLREMKTFVDASQAKAVKDAILEVIRIHREPMYHGSAPPPWRHALEENEAEASLDVDNPDARQQASEF